MATATKLVSDPPPIEGLIALPLASIRPNPLNPRTHFDATALKELADSIKTHGVQQPVLVRPVDPPAGKVTHELIVGERRWRASKLIDFHSIPAIVRPMSDRQALEVMILENLQRQDVHPLDEALGYKALLEQAPDPKQPKPTVESIAAKVGKSESYVYQRLKLAELIEPAQKKLRDGFITAAHAIDIARLQPDDQKRALEFCSTVYNRKRDQAPPFRELRKWIQENVQLNLDKAPFDTTDPKLLPAAGACTTCPKRTGSNPMLFEGMGKNTCTDPTCYQAKKMALVKINVESLEEKHGARPILISHHYWPPDGQKKAPGVLYSDNYTLGFWKNWKDHTVAKDSCKGTRLAVYIDSDEHGKGKAGATAYVCIDKKCQVHRNSLSSGNGGGSSDAAGRRRQISRHYRNELFKAVAAGLKKPTRADRELVLRELFPKLGHYQETPMVELLAWDEKITGYGPTAEKLRAAHFAKMSDADLDRYLVMMAIASDLVNPGGDYSGNMLKAERLEAVAARHKVNAAKILADAKAKFPDKSKKKSAVTKRAATAKKAATE